MFPTQILLIVVVSVLTTLLVVVGIQVVFILKDIRKSIKRANKILEDAGEVTSEFESLKDVRGLLNLVTKKTGLKGRKISSKIPDGMGEYSSKASLPRVFKRGGKPLSS